MTAIGAGIRIASGGGLHASLILLLPFKVSSDVSPTLAFTLLVIIYITLLLVTTLPGMLAFFFKNKKQSTERGNSTKLAKLVSSAVAGLFYFFLPSTLMITEGFSFGIIVFSTFFFTLGALLHRACLGITFSDASRLPFCYFALTIPILLILLRAWPL